MARNQVETCLWCDSTPCGCNTSTAKKPTSKKTVQVKQQQTSTPHEVTLESPRRSGLQTVSFLRELSEEEQEFRRALTLLCESGLVCSADIEKNAKDLNLTPTQVRLLVWKQRRAETIRR